VREKGELQASEACLGKVAGRLEGGEGSLKRIKGLSKKNSQGGRRARKARKKRKNGQNEPWGTAR